MKKTNIEVPMIPNKQFYLVAERVADYDITKTTEYLLRSADGEEVVVKYDHRHQIVPVTYKCEMPAYVERFKRLANL